MMSKETFEEWSNEHTNGLYCESRREIWNYRQKEIDELEKEVEDLRSEVSRARSFLDKGLIWKNWCDVTEAENILEEIEKGDRG